MCCDSWGCKESDTTEQLNRTELKGSITELTPSLEEMKLGVQKDQVLEFTGQHTAEEYHTEYELKRYEDFPAEY